MIRTYYGATPMAEVRRARAWRSLLDWLGELAVLVAIIGLALVALAVGAPK